MKSVKLYIHLLWMFFLTTVLVANSQNSFNPTGYASSLRDALKEPSSVATVSVYYTRGLIFDVEEGKPTPDASFEKLGELSNLRTFRLNGAPINFQQEPFFCNLSKVKQLESLELRMNFRQLGVLTERSIKCLSKLKSLKRLNLPNQYPAEEYIKLQQLLPNCEIVINMSPEGD
ncbi:MAG: hypothetical protein KBF36_08245 [Chitinophagaceae bacterium]|jgi:hypothetical protein|nr:hypothetical protein [Chitinophagaceae bacterium]